MIQNESRRLEEARADLARLIALEPGNREAFKKSSIFIFFSMVFNCFQARDMLSKAKERLRDRKQQEKERLSAAMKGGLYQEQHKKWLRKHR